MEKNISSIGSILVVDDDPGCLRVLAAVLVEAGYGIRLARGGEQALASAQALPPDLILLDIRMPGLDGYTVCEQLKAAGTTRHVPVIFLSGLGETLDKMRAFAVGGADYITKPFQAEEMLARIKTQLALCRLEQELHRKNQELEERVQERTAELATANANLQAEVERRQQSEQDKDKLLEVVRQQSEQLRTMMNWLIESRQDEQASLHDQMTQQLSRLDARLNDIQSLLTETLTPPSQEVILNQLYGAANILAQTRASINSLTDHLSRPPHPPEWLSDPLFSLTTREREVLQLLVTGKSTTEIAGILVLSISTVQTYRHRLMKKLNVTTMADLIKFALQHKLAA